MEFSLVAMSRGYSLWCAGFSLLVASLVALECAGSVVVAYGFGCSMASGTFLDQGLKPCPLHWMEDSYPLYDQRSPVPGIFGGRTLTP